MAFSQPKLSRRGGASFVQHPLTLGSNPKGCVSNCEGMFAPDEGAVSKGVPTPYCSACVRPWSITQSRKAIMGPILGDSLG